VSEITTFTALSRMGMGDGAPEMQRGRDLALLRELWATAEAARRGEETGVPQEGR
jgi:hypothetical protein